MNWVAVNPKTVGPAFSLECLILLANTSPETFFLVQFVSFNLFPCSGWKSTIWSSTPAEAEVVIHCSSQFILHGTACLSLHLFTLLISICVAKRNAPYKRNDFKRLERLFCSSALSWNAFQQPRRWRRAECSASRAWRHTEWLDFWMRLLEIPPFYPLVVPGWCFVVESVEQTVDLSQVRTTAPRSQCSDSAESESCKPWTEKKQLLFGMIKFFILHSRPILMPIAQIPGRNRAARVMKGINAFKWVY